MLNNNMPRRSALGLMSGIAAASALPGVATAAAPATQDFGAPEAKLRTLLLLRGALDDRLVIYWMRGRYYGLVDGEITPLFGVLNACFSRYRAHKDGGFIAARGEATHFTDFNTGEVMQTIRNPYTGKDMNSPVRSLNPSPVRIQADCVITIAEAPGMRFQNVVQDVDAQGDGVSISERSMSKTPVPGGKPSVFNELITYRGKASDLSRPGIKRAPCDTSVTSTVSWRSWMGMDDHPGHLLAAGAGTFVSSAEELPPAWIKATSVANPTMVNDPHSFLAPVWDTMN
jgi:hypothetical protein